MKDRRVFSKEVLSFPSPFAWYLCRSPTLSSTLSFGKAHSDTYLSLSLSQIRLSQEMEEHSAKQGEKKGKHSKSAKDFLWNHSIFYSLSLF